MLCSSAVPVGNEEAAHPAEREQLKSPQVGQRCAIVEPCGALRRSIEIRSWIAKTCRTRLEVVAVGRGPSVSWVIVET